MKPQETGSRHPLTKQAERILSLTLIVLALIGISIVIRRSLVLTAIIPASIDPSGRPAFDSAFSQHKLLTFLHIVPGLLFMILGPLQFVPSIRHRHRGFHRWNGRVFMLASLMVGTTAVCLPFFFLPIGGIVEAAGTILFGGWFLIALAMAFRHIRRNNIALHREWMIRAFSTGLSVSSVRPIIALFLAFSDLSPQQFFGIAFWLGFALHALMAEWWIRHTRTSL